MKAVLKRVTVVMAVILLTVGCLAVSAAAIAGGENGSGLEGYEGPPFAQALVRAVAGGGESTVPDGSPFAITGYAMSKGNGSIHVWIVSCTDVIKDLGYKPGDIVEILCSDDQVESIKPGDWIEVVGFTARDMLIWVSHNVLPEPFSY